MKSSKIRKCCTTYGSGNRQHEIFFMQILQFMTIVAVQFHGTEFGNTNIILGRVTILLSNQHFSSCADSKMFMNKLHEFVACYSKFLQSHSAMHVSFPNSNTAKLFSMGYRIITNEGTSSANNSSV
jgi:hypothetical protein